jgi:hypothetical protein
MPPARRSHSATGIGDTVARRPNFVIMAGSHTGQIDHELLNDDFAGALPRNRPAHPAGQLRPASRAEARYRTRTRERGEDAHTAADLVDFAGLAGVLHRDADADALRTRWKQPFLMITAGRGLALLRGVSFLAWLQRPRFHDIG